MAIGRAGSLNQNAKDAIAALRTTGPEVARLVSHRPQLDEISAVLMKKPPEGSLKVQAG